MYPESIKKGSKGGTILTKLRVGLTAIALVAVLAGVTASSAVSGSGPSDAMTLPLAIFVNQLELSPEQMLRVRDLLRNVLDQVDALELLRSEFQDAMIAFQGTREELADKVVSFGERIRTEQRTLRETAAATVDELKDTLTIRQGEIIGSFVRERLPGLVPSLGHVQARAPGPMLEGIRQRIESLREAWDEDAGLGERARREQQRLEALRRERDEDADMEAETRDEQRRLEGLRERIAQMLEGMIREQMQDAREGALDAPRMPTRPGPGFDVAAGLPERFVTLLRGIVDVLEQKLQINAVTSL
jgi:hypothetical protein